MHYIRDGDGGEELYDLLERSAREAGTSSRSAEHKYQSSERFRAMLLDVLTENPGSTEVEAAYLHELPDVRSSALVRDGDARGAGRRRSTGCGARIAIGPVPVGPAS